MKISFQKGIRKDNALLLCGWSNEEGTEFQDFLRVLTGMTAALQNDCRIEFDIDTTPVLQMDEV